MNGDRRKLLSLNESNIGSVIFGNDSPKNTKGKGMVSLDKGKCKAQNILFIDELKKNLLKA